MLPLLKKNHLIGIILLIAINSVGYIARAQESTPPSSVKAIIGKINDYNSKLPGEKLYLQFDKPYYSVGDTIWFKGYILSQALTYSPLSSRIYIDMVNDSNKVVKRYVFASAIGVSWGNVVLDDNTYHEGKYTLRAYTNWMRNFGEESFFYKSFYLADPLNNPFVVSADAALSDDAKNGVKAALKFSTIDRAPIENRDLEVKLMNGKKMLNRSTLQTDENGMINTNFVLPEGGIKNLALVATDKKDNRKTSTIPIDVNRAQDIDLQFMPEGGSLVAGLPSSVGFKAIGEDGRGIDVKGVILDKSNTEVANFESFHRGMGVLNLTPDDGDAYTAKVTLANGDTKTVPLPLVRKTGTVLRVRNLRNRDSIEVAILATEDMVGNGKTYHFIAESRSIICYGASLSFKDASTTARIAKSVFPSGLVHFTLFNDQDQPINDRLFFIDHHDNLKINIQTAKTYTPRDSIPMSIKVTDINNKPIVGTFSVAVTDNSQVKHDADNSGSNIITDMLLSGELKGYVEDPQYYLSENDESARALDALLLTQGWVGYNWKDIISGNTKPAFDPEPEFAIRGRVTNLFGKPIQNSSVLLLGSGKYKMMRDTTVDKNGYFTFNKLPLIADSTKFVLSAHTKSNRTVNGGITMSDPPLAGVTNLYSTPVKPWYVNTDSTLLNYVKTNNAYRFELDKVEFGGHGRLLNAVDIRDRAAVRNSQNLNGAGNSDQTLGTDVMEAAGKASLFDILQEKVKGFRVGFTPGGRGKTSNMTFYLKDKRIRFVIDGVDMDRFYTPNPGIPNDHYEYIKQTLDYITAEDLLGIEVLYSMQYIESYNTQNLTIDQQLAQNPAGPRGSQTAYLEITTRSGNGPFMRKATGIYVYKPRAITMPAVFYSPRYLVKGANADFRDMRSTIFWKNNIVTNKNGEAKFTFYAADKPTTYDVILEGSDMNGKIGAQTGKITISPDK